MKTILFLLAFVPATAFSQYSVMNFWGPYSAENWETFGEVSFTNSQLELLVTIFETQGGGNGGNGGNGGDELPSEEVVAEASVVLAHTGTLHLDPQWSIFTPECLEKVMFLNGMEVSLSSVENNGLSVNSGDVITFQILFSSSVYDDCDSGEWDLIIKDFQIEFDSLPCPSTLPTPDLDGDGWVGVPDLMIFLGAFGSAVN